MNKIVQIRQLLAEKLPGVRIATDPAPVREAAHWRTGLWALDAALGGGLTRGGLTELCGETGSGSALVLRQVIRQAASSQQWIALIDGTDCFDPGAFDNATLEHLLWLRCKNADEAVKCADLILRDGNLPIVVLDLSLNQARELRGVKSSTWYRFQRLVENGTSAFLTFTPMPLTSSAGRRLFLRSNLPAEAFELTEAELIERLVFEDVEAQREATRHIGTA